MYVRHLAKHVMPFNPQDISMSQEDTIILMLQLGPLRDREIS